VFGLLAALMASAAMLVAVSPAPAHADADNIWIGVLNPPGSSGERVLDVANYSEANRGRAHLWSLRTTGEVGNQRWNVKTVGTVNGHSVYKIVNVKSGKCLDKSEDVPNANGNAVYQRGLLARLPVLDMLTSEVTRTAVAADRTGDDPGTSGCGDAAAEDVASSGGGRPVEQVGEASAEDEHRKQHNETKDDHDERSKSVAADRGAFDPTVDDFSPGAALARLRA
jgi:hypothetical protein